MPTPLPTLFLSHGAPTFALEPGAAGAALRGFAERLPTPRAVLLLSPHWMTRGLWLTGASAPRTIHDFGGFPAPLYALQYPAPGDPALAARVQALLATQGVAATIDPQRGFDHGAWVPMMHLYPQADVPMVQLSMPADLDARTAAALGAALRSLRDDGVLVVGSGSLTHNLYELDPAAGERPSPEAQAFVESVSGDLAGGLRAEAFAERLMAAPGLARVHPTVEHLLPLPFARAAAGEPASVERLDGGYRYGVLSMHAFVFA